MRRKIKFTPTADGQLRLAQRYEKGDGVPLDEDLAHKWYEAAAESGSAVGRVFGRLNQ